MSKLTINESANINNYSDFYNANGGEQTLTTNEVIQTHCNDIASQLSDLFIVSGVLLIIEFILSIFISLKLKFTEYTNFIKIYNSVINLKIFMFHITIICYIGIMIAKRINYSSMVNILFILGIIIIGLIIVGNWERIRKLYEQD